MTVASTKDAIAKLGKHEPVVQPQENANKGFRPAICKDSGELAKVKSSHNQRSVMAKTTTAMAKATTYQTKANLVPIHHEKESVRLEPGPVKTIGKFANPPFNRQRKPVMAKTTIATAKSTTTYKHPYARIKTVYAKEPDKPAREAKVGKPVMQQPTVRTVLDTKAKKPVVTAVTTIAMVKPMKT